MLKRILLLFVVDLSFYKKDEDKIIYRELLKYNTQKPYIFYLGSKEPFSNRFQFQR